MTPSKSMPLENNHDFKEKYPYVCMGTLVSIRFADILTKNNVGFFCPNIHFSKIYQFPVSVFVLGSVQASLSHLPWYITTPLKSYNYK